jgi:dynein light chain 1
MPKGWVSTCAIITLDSQLPPNLSNRPIPAPFPQVELWGQCPPIEKMDGSLKALTACSYLSLSTNNIDKVGGLAGLSALRVLSLGRNCIKKLEGVEVAGEGLEELWISYNAVERLAGVEQLPALRVLYASNNRIKSWEEVERLGSLHHLEELLLVGNPIYNEYRDAGVWAGVSDVYSGSPNCGSACMGNIVN